VQYVDDDEEIDESSAKSSHADENMDAKRAKKGGKAGMGGGKAKTNSRLAHLPEDDDVSVFTQRFYRIGFYGHEYDHAMSPGMTDVAFLALLLMSRNQCIHDSHQQP
jgi:hypothetical protein